jgi:hypothetical protein
MPYCCIGRSDKLDKKGKAAFLVIGLVF